MGDIDKIIHNLFSARWSGDLNNAPIEKMRAQLYKNLQNQVDGYWSGHSAYQIMIEGGFLIDSKRIRDHETGKAKGKRLTEMGKMFVESMRAN